MLMGLACPLEGWRAQLDFFCGQATGQGWELEAGLRQRVVCCVIDNRGVGRSSAPADRQDYSMELMADDAVCVMDHLGWESAHVMGHSMGSMICTRLACMYPDRVDSLTLVSTSGGGWDFLPPRKGLFRMLQFACCSQTAQSRAEFDLRCHFTKRWLRDRVHLEDHIDSPPRTARDRARASRRAKWRAAGLALMWTAPGSSEGGRGGGEGELDRSTTPRKERLYREYVHSALEGTTAQKPEGFKGQLSAVLQHRVTDRDVQNLVESHFPILLIHGTKDKVVSLSAGQNLARRLGTRARLLQTYGAHFVHREQAEEVNMAIQLQLLKSERRPFGTPAPSPSPSLPEPSAKRKLLLSRNSGVAGTLKSEGSYVNLCSDISGTSAPTAQSASV